MAIGRAAIARTLKLLMVLLKPTEGGVRSVSENPNQSNHMRPTDGGAFTLPSKIFPLSGAMWSELHPSKAGWITTRPAPAERRSGRGQRRRPSRRRKCLKGSAMALGPLKFLMFWDQAPSGGKLRCLKYAIKPTTCAPPTAALLSCLPKPPLVSPRLSHPSCRTQSPRFADSRIRQTETY